MSDEQERRQREEETKRAREALAERERQRERELREAQERAAMKGLLGGRDKSEPPDDSDNE
jgi:hypothetical protein